MRHGGGRPFLSLRLPLRQDLACMLPLVLRRLSGVRSIQCHPAGPRQHPGKKGGPHTGPNPTDRGRQGVRHHLMVDRAGTPLACLLTPANAHDGWSLRPLAQRAARRMGTPAGCKGHDQPRNRAALEEVGAIDRIARKRIDTGGLGGHRHVVERGFSHLCGLHRLQRCYERDPWQHLAFLRIARKINKDSC